MFECSLVPLRYRREDLPVLMERFFQEILLNTGSEKKRIPEPVSKLLLEYSWPGNIRELRNVLERLVLLSKDREILLDDLPHSVREGIKSKQAPGILKSLAALEREQIERVLNVEPSQERAAEILGITTVTLWRKRKEYGLP